MRDLVHGLKYADRILLLAAIVNMPLAYEGMPGLTMTHAEFRAGARNVQALPAGDEAALSGLSGRMDVVLVDAPCTGSGVWRRRHAAVTNDRPAGAFLGAMPAATPRMRSSTAC
jgi:hypothetical protein